MLIAVWAMDQNRLIGRGGRLPWSVPAELQHFRRVTAGQKLLVGRVTFASLPLTMQRHRQLLVASRDQQLTYHQYPNVRVVNDLAPVIANHAEHPTNHLYVIGGAQIYQRLWTHFDQLIVSYVRGRFTGDVYFPVVDWRLFRVVKTVSNPEFKVVCFQRRGGHHT